MIEKNQEIGLMQIFIPNKDTIEIPLLAKNEVKKTNLLIKEAKKNTY